jgi:anti-sigma B factor antagonist
MEITVIHENDLIIKLKGRLDTTTSIKLDERIKEEEIKENNVILDFKELEYISSAGLRTLLQLKKNLASENKTLEIHNINAVVKEVFNVTGFKNILTIK